LNSETDLNNNKKKEIPKQFLFQKLGRNYVIEVLFKFFKKFKLICLSSITVFSCQLKRSEMLCNHPGVLFKIKTWEGTS
jgi:hypothetical protein